MRFRFCNNADRFKPWTKKKAAQKAATFVILSQALALARFEPALRLIDDVNAALAAHNPAITVPVLQRTERVSNLHWSLSLMSRRMTRLLLRFAATRGGDHGGRYWDRTSDPFDVNEVLYR